MLMYLYIFTYTFITAYIYTNISKYILYYHTYLLESGIYLNFISPSKSYISSILVDNILNNPKDILEYVALAYYYRSINQSELEYHLNYIVSITTNEINYIEYII